jgi:hypothetical protein
MKEWEQYSENPVKDRLLNGIGLELSHTEKEKCLRVYLEAGNIFMIPPIAINRYQLPAVLFNGKNRLANFSSAILPCLSNWRYCSSRQQSVHSAQLNRKRVPKERKHGNVCLNPTWFLVLYRPAAALC